MSIAGDPHVAQLIERAKQEDLGCGDCTTNLLDRPRDSAVFRLMAKHPGVFAGVETAPDVLRAFDPKLRLTWLGGVRDGLRWDEIPREIAQIEGSLQSILAAERTLLNFLQRLCGVATLTRQLVDAVAGTQAAIYDTRKTIPGWRVLDKYAVRCGGGNNHRVGLFDAVLIKDNHLSGVESSRLAAAVFDMLNRLGEQRRNLSFVAVEAVNLEQVEQLLRVVGVDVILLDNMSLESLREAVLLRDGHGLRNKVALEASGGVRLDNVRAIAETGVDRISVGVITHSAPALDLSLERLGYRR